MGNKSIQEDKVKRFETFDHGADIGIRGYGKSVEETFVNGAKALFYYMYQVSEPVEENLDIKEITFELEENDLTSLFIRFLNTLIAESDINSLAFFDFSLKIEGLKLKGKARGYPIKTGEIGVEVKGATYCEAKVEQKNGIWVAQCVIDV